MICHLLIGPPGSGKSTFAQQLATLANYQIVSTDRIREQLYGNASIQGYWNEIELQVLQQIQSAIALNQPVIYDATNAKRAWRMSLLMQLNSDSSLTPGDDRNLECKSEPILWMAWHLKTPLEICQQRNLQRDRTVPEEVIVSMFKSLKNFPPLPAEGFAAVNNVPATDGEFDIIAIQNKIQNLDRTLTNRSNRTKHRQITIHQYSQLQDFDRLLHLIALIIRYLGIGYLHINDPKMLEYILGKVQPFATTSFSNSIDEICAVMHQQKGNIYADYNAIVRDLQWLQQNQLVSIEDNTISTGDRTNPITLTTPPRSPGRLGGVKNNMGLRTVKNGNLGEVENDIDVTIIEDSNLITHAYSDVEPFKRLLKIIRFILQHPFLPNSENRSQKVLIDTLAENQILIGECLDTLQKDIENILKPYQILPEFPLRHGYFAGTAILSQRELNQVFRILQSQAKSLEDSEALAVFEMFKERMKLSKLNSPDYYPVRAIANRCIIDNDSLPKTALSWKLDQLETAIISGELLELSRVLGGGRFSGDADGFFLVWPLQIVFYNFAWYLGFECESKKDKGLLRFERLDRLFLGQRQGRKRDRTIQEESLQKLNQLLAASAGIFLGDNTILQQQFLSSDKKVRSGAEITVELWFSDGKFRFVAEGTKRFPVMKMSPPAGGKQPRGSKSLFSLQPTGDAKFPHRFRVVLPKWSLNDVNLEQWIIGFGGNVKVVKPPELVEKIKNIGDGIVRVYCE
ncbi:MAG: WYL domain-containing protein [Microcoleus sp. PH2017_10_PVI_O_A]|uniref:WYL domain-containing protein n=1 Tax=unclassified Microcoleus TaxID=2642155 RepID=UPI001D87220E|nr:MULTISPECIES: WYL domain-containing protein [unclassified Microcoleus]TAF19801.1 MAG: WYL domain-containing protein [Oscillatoriales cyanobacterium]MCC3406756.1 WYL domain-containing protein [Microcoleus sp. PH2017_10_PVI_O_A]MCC3460892.1 WYL domain-containing protein [Microcoleus sp. PH2017_11_PCY_U_A]MCC3479413.1 WYL domain-containing protein [Microcoleus sp. PH2017_12_PCY_D_A]MCC3529342.1 WYL domain-containing protein [Microcoleus sp. PH2017_21_RUC_O_A]